MFFLPGSSTAPRATAGPATATAWSRRAVSRSRAILSSDRVRNAPPGHLYAVVTDGYGAMPDYSYQLDEHDRWAVVAYIGAFERSRHATLDDAPADVRSRLESQR